VSLRKIAVGTALVSSASLIRVVMQFIALPVLSRLLTPTDYGLLGIAMPFIAFAMLIADAGVGMSLVRTAPLTDRVVWSTSFWVILILGTGLALILGAFAPIAAYIFDEPRLQPIVLVLAITVIAQAAAIIPGAALQKSQQFQTIAAIEVTTIIISVAITITIGYLGGGVWALVGQQMAFFTIRPLMTFVLSPFRPTLAFDLSGIKSHLTFGRDVLGVNIIGHIAGSIDNLVIGRVLGSASVGFYAMAMQFIRLPTVVITGPLQYVLYSHLAVIKDDLPAIRRTFLVVTRVLAILLFPAIGLVAAAHHATFNILLSEKWQQAGLLFMILAPASAVQAMMALGGDIMLVLGRPDLRLRTTIEFSLLWICALVLVAGHGISWIAIAYNCAVLLYMPRLLRLILSLIDCRLVSYIEAIIIPAVMTIAAVLIYVEVNRFISPTDYIDVILGAGLAILAILCSAALQFRALAKESALLALPFASQTSHT
jgi:O-antigen/teichoic acid export membrane protein